MVIVASLLFCLGLAGLWKSSDWLVDSGAKLAAYYRLPPIIIGLSLVAFGTSAPELAINLLASVNKEPDIVWGNILGSNIANTTLILGLAGIVTPLTVSVFRSTPILAYHVAVPVILCSMLVVSTTLTWLAGLILLGLFAGFVWVLYKTDQLPPEASDTVIPTRITPVILLFIAACILLPTFAYLVMNQAIYLAELFNVSPLFISLFLVSLGSSLPELITCLNAALKKQSDMILGNIIGSNIFNLSLVLGSSVIVSPIRYHLSLYLELGLIIVLPVILFSAARYNYAITKLAGIGLVGLYSGYIIVKYVSGS